MFLSHRGAPCRVLGRIAIPLSFSLLLVCARPTLAQDPSVSEALEKAREAFAPPSDADLAQAKAQLNQNLDELDQMLRNGTNENHLRWHRFLGWDALRNQLSGSEADPHTLLELHKRFTRNQRGLEMERFGRVRSSLRRYREAVLATKVRPEEYREVLNQLAERLKRFSETRSGEDGAVIGHAIGWLEAARQAPELVAVLRRHYWNQNMLAEISEEFVAAGLQDTVSERSSINDFHQGTTIQGVADMNGELDVEFVPDIRQAHLRIRLLGKAVAQSNGYHGRVTIVASGVTQIQASKSLLVNDEGVHAQSAKASCQTSASIDGVCAPSCLVQRIASRKAYQGQGAAEYRASRNAEQQIAARMDEKASGMLADAQTKFDDKFRFPLIRRGEYPREIRFQTTDDRIHLGILQCNARQIGSWTEPPRLEGKRDIAVRVHESLVANFSEAFIGGETITDERLEQIVLEMTGDVPEELKIGPDKDPWSITFAADRPVSAEFQNDTVRMSVHGRRFTRGDPPAELKHNVVITALYEIKRDMDPMRMVRRGDVEIHFVGRDRLSAAQIAFKTFLRKKFAAMFKPEIQPEPLRLKGKWERLGKVEMDQLASGDGWMTLVWNRKGPANKPSPDLTASTDPATSEKQLASDDSESNP